MTSEEINALPEGTVLQFCCDDPACRGCVPLPRDVALNGRPYCPFCGSRSLTPSEVSAGPSRGMRRKLPSRRGGYTQKLRIGDEKLFLRTGDYEDGALGEIFVDMARIGDFSRGILSCFAIAVSVALQYGVPLDEFVDAFVFTRFAPAGPVGCHGRIKMASSVVDLIFRDLGINYLGREDLAHVEDSEDAE